MGNHALPGQESSTLQPATLSLCTLVSVQSMQNLAHSLSLWSEELLGHEALTSHPASSGGGLIC